LIFAFNCYTKMLLLGINIEIRTYIEISNITFFLYILIKKLTVKCQKFESVIKGSTLTENTEIKKKFK